MVSLNVLPKSYSHQADISEDCLLQIFISLSLTLLLSQNFFISLTFLSLHVFISLHTHFSLTLSLSYFTISLSLSLILIFLALCSFVSLVLYGLIYGRLEGDGRCSSVHRLGGILFSRSIKSKCA